MESEKNIFQVRRKGLKFVSMIIHFQYDDFTSLEKITIVYLQLAIQKDTNP